VYGQEHAPPPRGPDSAGYYDLDDGTRFRLPTIEDERALYGLAEAEHAQTLFARCIVPSGARVETGFIEKCMEAIGPVLNVELDALCPLCGASQSVQFEMVSFFLSMLAKERPLLSREIHSIARAYRWSFEEIVSLPRSERRAHVALIEGEHGPEEAPL
jgi:hypothetical protein